MRAQRFTEVVKTFRHAPPLAKVPPRSPRPGSFQPPRDPVGLRYCGFCGCAESDAWQMVAGRSAHICGDCVVRACEAIADGDSVIPPDQLRRCLGVWERFGAWLLAQRR
jgi:ClpX C4-type zinc finger